MSEINTDLNGILLLDKPIGYSSHNVVNTVRKETGVKRVGHTGTLDPFATGLLIILVGKKFTKLQDLFLKQDKHYLCEFELGYETTTLDKTGELTLQTPQDQIITITQKQVQTVMKQFIGPQLQQAPAFAAIKVAGEKLYSHALKLLHNPDHADFEAWQSQLPKRQIEIFEIVLTQFHAACSTKSACCTISVHCSSGTYIRSLIRDIGKALNTYATAISLKRTQIGTIRLSDAQQVDQPESWVWHQKTELLN